MYRYELHAHTNEVSRCAHVSAERVVESYAEAGYNGIVITNHLNSATFQGRPEILWSEQVSHFLSAYHLAKKAAPEHFTVFLGMELTFTENGNDYLVYGLDEEFLFYNEYLREMNIRQFSELAHANGLLIFQAHPFRNGMNITDPKLLDGIEVYNGNANHDSRNDIAHLWADKYGLLTSSGSDYHQARDIARGGIIAEKPLLTQKDLLAALKSRAKLIETK